jgi:copper(I)-binding protein
VCQLRLLSVAIASPGARGGMHLTGDSAALLLTIANDGKAEDVLTGARADVASTAAAQCYQGRRVVITGTATA